MELSGAFWQLFAMSGHVGAYLLYRDCLDDEKAELEFTQDSVGEQDQLSNVAGSS